ncbi:hypothetical protein EFL96_09530 [Lactococcus lactis]|uniref:Uncharacterized protein n=1 Tax=Lactococcus lactis TaxID=1358 RepID=A0A6B3S7S2_9LACT|nr:hypothetical protein [Lactococcus lactis]MCT1174455.1 hypothetical protein [Lactococcus lactis]MCT1186585.1 hypothetical protein [Lactococcus lactis]MCT1190173.1 hypothetical protein [Lactococcus lactis]MCT1195424.1 hypothetical protein [Lactococcus lactis]MCT1228195.1 hypothetical protein [Lactococcus lactis]
MSETGLDELIDDLENMLDKARDLDGENDVIFSDIFTESFLKNHTGFSSLEDFADASRFDWTTPKSFEAIPNDELDIFVRKNSQFNSWEEMLETASSEYIQNQLGF